VTRVRLEPGRGQLVLLTAAVVAVAIVPLAFAYFQLGYDADVRAGGDHADPGRDATRVLSRAVHEAALSADGPWAARSAVVDRTRNQLEPRLETLRTARVERGTVFQVSYDSAAADWAARNCPGGPARQFGDCESRRGVVVQERAGETHVVAVGFDVSITTERGSREITLVVRAVGGPAE
jgi:hypothetical protein